MFLVPKGQSLFDKWACHDVDYGFPLDKIKTDLDDMDTSVCILL